MKENIKFSWKSFHELSNDEIYEILHLRQEVFVVEQNCPYLDADYCDQDAFHLIGLLDEKHLDHNNRHPNMDNFAQQQRPLVLNVKFHKFHH